MTQQAAATFLRDEVSASTEELDFRASFQVLAISSFQKHKQSVKNILVNAVTFSMSETASNVKHIFTGFITRA